LFFSESTYQRPKIDWDSLSSANEEYTKGRWKDAAPLLKDFYHEDPAVANMHPKEVEAIRWVS
jgi:hypothetical protein